MLLDFEQLIAHHQMKIKGVIHIGAHYGQEHNLYRKNNINNIIYFEPLKKNFEVLRQNVDENTVLYNYALGNEEKDVEMFVESNNNGQSSSILEPDLHKEQYPHIVFNEKQIVEMKKLNSFGIDYSKYNFINIDVQGYELEVFKGGTSALPHIDYIISEVNRGNLYKNCAMVEDLDKFLSDFGFVRKDTSWVGGSWGDALYVKE